MSSKSIPLDIRNLLMKLDFLGQIDRGKKPCMNDMTLVDASSWIGAIKRYWNGESRGAGLKEIEEVVEQAISAIQIHQEQEFLFLIVNHLSKARLGIESLKTTYRADHKVISSVGVILSNIDLQLQKNRHVITGYANHDFKIYEDETPTLSPLTPTAPSTTSTPPIEPIKESLEENKMQPIIPNLTPLSLKKVNILGTK